MHSMYGIKIVNTQQAKFVDNYKNQELQKN
jgi:hypothetical protein